MQMHRRIATLLLLAAIAAGCSGGPVSPSPSASLDATVAPSAPEPSAVAGAERLEDLDELVAQLARHPEPYIGEDEATFTARVDAVRAQAATVSDIGFLIAVMDLTGHRDQDGHTGTFAFAQENAGSAPGRSGCGTSPTVGGSSSRARGTRTCSAHA